MRRSRPLSIAAERAADIHMPLPSLWSAWCNTGSLRQWRKEADAEEALWRPVWLDDRRGAFVLRQEQTEPEDM